MSTATTATSTSRHTPREVLQAWYVLVAIAASVGGAEQPRTEDGFSAVLSGDGSINVTGPDAVTFVFTSSFSEPGPTFHRFGRSASDAGARGGWTVSAVGAAITGTAKDFSVKRQIFVESNRIVVNDTVRASAAARQVVGMEVQHRAEILGTRVREATVPGAPWAFRCTSLFGDDASGRSLHRGTSGNPTIHVQAVEGGLGMLPLDDAFEVHSWSNNSAVPRFPRMPTAPTGNPSSRAPFEPAYPDCPVTSPPSLTLTDPYFALAPGAEYTMEWAIYPGNSSCTDYFCFINRVREDIGVSKKQHLVCILPRVPAIPLRTGQQSDSRGHGRPRSALAPAHARTDAYQRRLRNGQAGGRARQGVGGF